MFTIRFRLLFWSLGLLIFHSSAHAQNFYNYPVPVNGISGGGGKSTNTSTDAKGANPGTGDKKNGSQDAAETPFDRNTGLTDSNTRYNRLIHDQLDIVKRIDDVYFSWQKLAILGKDQYEIEEFYREIPPDIISRVKERLRNRIMYNLERRRLSEYTNAAYDIVDVKIALRMVGEETRRFSLEFDSELKSRINDRYGLNPFILSELAYVVQ